MRPRQINKKPDKKLVIVTTQMGRHLGMITVNGVLSESYTGDTRRDVVSHFNGEEYDLYIVDGGLEVKVSSNMIDVMDVVDDEAE